MGRSTNSHRVGRDRCKREYQQVQDVSIILKFLPQDIFLSQRKKESVTHCLGFVEETCLCPVIECKPHQERHTGCVSPDDTLWGLRVSELIIFLLKNHRLHLTMRIQYLTLGWRAFCRTTNPVSSMVSRSWKLAATWEIKQLNAKLPGRLLSWILAQSKGISGMLGKSEQGLKTN